MKPSKERTDTGVKGTCLKSISGVCCAGEVKQCHNVILFVKMFWENSYLIVITINTGTIDFITTLHICKYMSPTFLFIVTSVHYRWFYRDVIPYKPITKTNYLFRNVLSFFLVIFKSGHFLDKKITYLILQITKKLYQVCKRSYIVYNLKTLFIKNTYGNIVLYFS